MARLADLGQPFGSPGRIVNVPAPAGAAQAAAQQQQAFQQAADAIADMIRQGREKQAQQADFSKLAQFAQQNRQFGQQQQQFQGQGPLLAGLAPALEKTFLEGKPFQTPLIPRPTPPAIPALESQRFGGFQDQILQERIFGEGGPRHTLSPGQELVTAQGRRVARVPAQPPARAGALQVARADSESGLPEGTVFQEDPQGNVKVISSPQGEGLSKADKSKIAITQAAEFRADPRVKDLQIIERSEKGMEAALKLSTSPNVKSRIASDQALGVLFQKMLDPTSVVRESEFARTPEGAAAVNRLLAIAPQLRLGGLRLLDEDRVALVDMAKVLLREAKVSANTAFDEFDVRATELDLNKKIVFGGRKRFDIGGDPLGFTDEEQVELDALDAKATQPSRTSFGVR